MSTECNFCGTAQNVVELKKGTKKINICPVCRRLNTWLSDLPNEDLEMESRLWRQRKRDQK